eukprot:g861.t1
MHRSACVFNMLLVMMLCFDHQAHAGQLMHDGRSAEDVAQEHGESLDNAFQQSSTMASRQHTEHELHVSRGEMQIRCTRVDSLLHDLWGVIHEAKLVEGRKFMYEAEVLVEKETACRTPTSSCLARKFRFHTFLQEKTTQECTGGDMEARDGSCEDLRVLLRRVEDVMRGYMAKKRGGLVGEIREIARRLLQREECKASARHRPGRKLSFQPNCTIPSEGLYELKESCLLASDVVVEGNQTLTIVGEGAPTIDRGGNGRHFTVIGGGHLNVTSVTLANGNILEDDNGGGAVLIIDTGYWESLVLLRKASLSGFAVFLSNRSTTVQVAVALLILYICHIVHILVQPLEHDWHNWMESRSLGASLLILFACLLGDASGKINGRLSSEASICVSLAVSAMTLWFIWTSIRVTLFGILLEDVIKDGRKESYFVRASERILTLCCRVRKDDAEWQQEGERFSGAFSSSSATSASTTVTMKSSRVSINRAIEMTSWKRNTNEESLAEHAMAMHGRGTLAHTSKANNLSDIKLLHLNSARRLVEPWEMRIAKHGKSIGAKRAEAAQRLDRLFSLWDRDKSGSLELHEISSISQKLGMRTSPMSLDDIKAMGYTSAISRDDFSGFFEKFCIEPTVDSVLKKTEEDLRSKIGSDIHDEAEAFKVLMHDGDAELMRAMCEHWSSKAEARQRSKEMREKKRKAVEKRQEKAEVKFFEPIRV